MPSMPNKYFVGLTPNKSKGKDLFRVIRGDPAYLPWYTFEGIQFIKVDINEVVVYEDTSEETARAVCKDLNRRANVK